jgi:hypothetical protein
MIKINEYRDKLSNILLKLDIYKESDTAKDTTIKLNINKQLNSYTKIDSLENNTTFLLDKINEFITNYINTIDIQILKNSQKIIDTVTYANNSYIYYLKVATNIISNSSYHINHSEAIAAAIAADITLIGSNYSNYLLYNNISNNYEFSSKNGIYIEDNYFELPSKISDNNDEYILTFKATDGLIKYNTIYLYCDLKNDKSDNYLYNSKYIKNSTTNNPITIIPSKKFEYTLNISDNAELAKYTIPFVLIKNNSTYIEKFKKIILAVLFNGICNIQSKFENKDLFDKIRRYQGATLPLFQLNKIYIMQYYDLFTQAFITHSNKNDPSLLLKDNSYISFYILLFNVYQSQFIDIKKTINTNINYLMNNSNKLTNSNNVINILNTIITETLLLDEKINSDNNDNDKDDEILKLYNNNKLIINLIVVLFENLLITIKNEINKDTSYNSLCFSPSTSALIIQKAINTTFGNIENTAGAGVNYNTLAKGLDSADGINKMTQALITKLNNHLKNYFNIVIFLLDNLKLNTNTSEIDAIVTNYNFYNKDDNIKNTIQKRLIISCDYYSKYNNMNSKQLSYFKINSDNVNYNFPILIIIFLIILGEPIFIKS